MSFTWQCAMRNVAHHREGLQFFWTWDGLASNPSLLSTAPRPAGPPKPSLLLANPSLPLARLSLLSARPSFLLAKPARANPEDCEPPEPPEQLLCVKWQTLIAHWHVACVVPCQAASGEAAPTAGLWQLTAFRWVAALGSRRSDSLD